MDWSKGYSASYYMTEVDPVTWRDIAQVEITGGSIKKERTGLIESADINVINYNQDREKWLRIYLTAQQQYGGERVALFTGLGSTPDSDYVGNLKSTSIQCYSVLKPAETVYLDIGWYAPYGIDGAQLVKQLLSVTPAPVVVEGNAPSLKESIIAENDESHLTMAGKILDAINWRYKISGDGTITICPKPTEAIVHFDPTNNDVIENEIKTENDWYDCPNVFRAISDDLMAIAKDEDPESPFSIPSRGREIWEQEENCDLADDETIAEYAYRRLKEEQSYSVSVTYDRRFIPDVVPSDMVDLYLPMQDVKGLHIIDSQTINIGKSNVTEKVVKVWR